MLNLHKIALALNAKKSGNGYICCCPSHKDANPSLYLYETKSGKLGAKCFAGCSYSDIKQKLASLGVIFETNNNYVSKVYNLGNPKDTKNPKVLDYKKKSYIQNILSEATSNLENTPVEIYLRKHRGVEKSELPASLKYHPNLWHSATQKSYPAMLAAVQNIDGEVIGLHRTYLDEITNNKADITPNKMMLGNISGGAVRLSGALFAPLIVCEGIETGLSILEAVNYPVWALLSASNFESFSPPPITQVSSIIIATDNDEAGQKASEKLATRLVAQSYSVNVVKPENANDFNELLKGN
ncbi:MAG: toprim domain-containing protein [Rickettsiales bacterium]|nr:toprim domain-containing protein [Rickettsiales bacterium]